MSMVKDLFLEMPSDFWNDGFVGKIMAFFGYLC